MTVYYGIIKLFGDAVVVDVTSGRIVMFWVTWSVSAVQVDDTSGLPAISVAFTFIETALAVNPSNV